MLSNHSKNRDEYGLPIVGHSTRREWIGFNDEAGSIEACRETVTWNAEHKQLRYLIEEARDPIQTIIFMQRWLMPHLQIHDYSATRSLARAVIVPSNDKSIQEEVDLLNQIAKAATTRREQLVRASAVLIEHALGDISDKLLPRTPVEILCDPPQGLLRVWGPKSHTKYDKQLGFRCSAWTECGPASTFKKLDLSIFSVRSLKSHCENESRASDWISLSGEISWTLKYIDKHWPTDSVLADSMSIALISTAKMKRMKLLFDRSDLLLHSVGGSSYKQTNPEGVRFTWAGHYLVYGWIPVQCIVTTFTLAQFRDICEGRNIRPGQLYGHILVSQISLIRRVDDVISVDPFTLLEDDPHDTIGSTQQYLGNLSI